MRCAGSRTEAKLDRANSWFRFDPALAPGFFVAISAFFFWASETFGLQHAEREEGRFEVMLACPCKPMGLCHPRASLPKESGRSGQTSISPRLPQKLG